MGYTRKSDGKRVLEKHFTIDIDYKVEKAAVEQLLKMKMRLKI